MSDYEKYEIIEIDRKDVKNAPYNPRKITAEARKKIQSNIEKVGLLSPIIWNEVTGNIVSGHQRIKCMDKLEGKKEYKLRVSKVVLDEKSEKEQNVFLNNKEVQGEFDIFKLEELNKEIDLTISGFDDASIFNIFGKEPEKLDSEVLLELSRKIKENEKHRNKIKDKSGKDNGTYYAVLIFRDEFNRDQFLDLCGLSHETFVDGRIIENLIKS